MNKNATRYFSSKQERQIAKKLNGNCQVNSGATLFNKGDIQTKTWLIEAKTTLSEKQSFSIKQEWLNKIKQESFAMNKEYYALAFNFSPNTPNYYIIDERTMQKILKILEEI